MELVLSLEDLAKYPFSVEAQEYIRSRGITVEDLLQPEYADVLGRAIERVEEAILRSQVSVKLDRPEVEVLSYPAAVMVASLCSDRAVSSRYAEAEARRAYGLLRREPPEKVLRIARGTFNWDVDRAGVKVGPRAYEYSMSWLDYLKVAMGFKSPHWKLVNRPLANGRVYLQRHELARMVAEALRGRLLSRLSSPPSMEPPQPIREAVERLRSLASARAVKVEGLDLQPTSTGDVYPPCIRRLLDDALSGRQLPHMARFTLASFLLSVGKSVEEVVDVFRRLPDFDERKTTYHVRHIAGEIGSRTRYVPPSCETMRTYNLCNPTDPLCHRVKHPLGYVKLRLKASRRAVEVVGGGR